MSTKWWITHDGQGVVKIKKADTRPSNTLEGPFPTRSIASDHANKQQVELERGTRQPSRM
jgi:hypothetical protein